VEKYSFSPSNVLAQLTVQQYVHFLIHAMEYRMLITEQMSENLEKAYLVCYMSVNAIQCMTCYSTDAVAMFMSMINLITDYIS
jgi:hypothetical protein